MINLAKNPSFFAKGPQNREKILSPRVAIILAQMLPGLFRSHLLISPLGRTSLQSIYYSKTQRMVLSRKKNSCWGKSHLIALENAAVILEQLQESGLIRTLPPLLCSCLPQQGSSLRDVCTSFNQLLGSSSPLLSAPQIQSTTLTQMMFYRCPQLLVIMPPVIGYYLFAYWKTTKVGTTPFPNSTNQLN